MFCEIPYLGRCCFCIPLRRGVLIFGYLNVVVSAFLIGMVSFSVHADVSFTMVYHGTTSNIIDIACLTFYCLDVIFNVAMVYGAHRKILIYIKVYYNYLLATTLLMFVLEFISGYQTYDFEMYAIEALTLFFAALCIHIYLIILTRSLVRKLELSDQNTYENQLHAIVNGDLKVDGNGVYPSTVIPNEAA